MASLGLESRSTLRVELSTEPHALELVSLLTEVAAKLASSRSFDEMASAVLAVLEQVVTVEYTGFFALDPTDGRLRLYAARGFSEQDRLEAERTAPERHPGWVVRHGQMLHVPDIDADELKRSTDSLGHKIKLRSRLYVPVMSGRACVGAFALASTQPYMFTDAHIAMLKYAASLIGATYGSLANEQRLHRQLQLLSQKQAELLLLSSPVIEVWDRTLALPIIGSMDQGRAAYMAERLLSMVATHRAHTVILDFTGTDEMGSRCVTEILRIVGAVELLGGRCVFSGVSPALAKTLAGDNVVPTSVKSHATLKQALAVRIQLKP